jgi:hypothetical protein
MGRMPSRTSKSKRRGRWDEAAARFEHFMSEFARCASNTDCRFDPVYASLFAVRDLLRSRSQRESEMV